MQFRITEADLHTFNPTVNSVVLKTNIGITLDYIFQKGQQQYQWVLVRSYYSNGDVYTQEPRFLAAHRAAFLIAYVVRSRSIHAGTDNSPG